MSSIFDYKDSGQRKCEAATSPKVRAVQFQHTTVGGADVEEKPPIAVKPVDNKICGHTELTIRKSYENCPEYQVERVRNDLTDRRPIPKQLEGQLEQHMAQRGTILFDPNSHRRVSNAWEIYKSRLCTSPTLHSPPGPATFALSSLSTIGNP
ncbi:hypothetical protein V5O48_017484 [Marasmius crinis-equi]|uniref:Uncharacterized protein n=1 Tax=Marasmius crinis-equi TaxID=585013 RepID=A0ABR3ENW1_9AGAR